jgi:hypothetical protein
VLLDGLLSLVHYRDVEYRVDPRISLRLARIEYVDWPLTVAGVFVMRLLIVGGGAVITSDAGGCVADLARGMGVAVATTRMDKRAVHDDDPPAVSVIGYYGNGTDGWTVFPNDGTLPAPTRVALEVLTDPVRLPANHWLGQLVASPGSATRRRLNRGRLPRVDIMTTADADYFRQKIADIGADGRCVFELPQAPDFALEGRSRFAAGAVDRAVSG